MNDKFRKELAKVITLIDDPKLAEAFLSNILTPKDLDEISVRLQIFKLLFKGVPQREVSEKLGVSIGTVSRGSRELKYGEPGVKVILAKNGKL